MFVTKNQEKWEKQAKIGSGSYGNVYKAIDKTTSQLIAIKKIKAPIEEDGIPTEILREIVILRNINHPNVIKLQDVVYTSEKMYLIFEYMDLDLKNFIDSYNTNDKIPMNLIKEIIRQILNGLTYIHLEGVLHRDLKPQNVLINYENQESTSNTSNMSNMISLPIVKLADFGLARTFSNFSKNLSKNTSKLIYFKHKVTPLYRAPEIFFGSDNYTTAIDLWSVGCIFAELVNKKPLFTGNQEIDIIRKIFALPGCTNEDVDFMFNSLDSKYSKIVLGKDKAKERPWEDICPDLDPIGIDLISKMLVIDPSKRISAYKALQHDYFK